MAETVEGRITISAEQLGLQPGDHFEGQLDYDLGNLMACDPSPQDVQALTDNREAHMLETATLITQSLVASLFALPGRLAAFGRVVDLPGPAFQLPRQKPLPTPRPPTRWETFAQQKGIQKRKRSVKVWDEEQQEWRRRYGYQRAGDERDIPIIEAGANDQVGEDPFTQMKKDKAGRVKSGEKLQLANVKHSLKAAGRGSVPPTLKLAASLPEHGRGKPSKRKELKQDIRQASKQAGVATASMGKFDKRLEGEKPGERQLGSKRRKFEPVVGDASGEQAKVTSTVDRILREHADDIVDMDRAISSVKKQKKKDADAEPDRGSRKPGKGGKPKKGSNPTKGGKGRKTAASGTSGKKSGSKLGMKGSKMAKKAGGKTKR